MDIGCIPPRSSSPTQHAGTGRYKGLSASVEGIGGHGQRHLSYARVLNSVGPARLLFGAALAALRLHPGAMWASVRWSRPAGGTGRSAPDKRFLSCLRPLGSRPRIKAIIWQRRHADRPRLLSVADCTAPFAVIQHPHHGLPQMAVAHLSQLATCQSAVATSTRRWHVRRSGVSSAGNRLLRCDDRRFAGEHLAKGRTVPVLRSFRDTARCLTGQGMRAEGQGSECKGGHGRGEAPCNLRSSPAAISRYMEFVLMTVDRRSLPRRLCRHGPPDRLPAYSRPPAPGICRPQGWAAVRRSSSWCRR